MGFFSNSIKKENLKAGDHIYSWRTAFIYTHHGIYVGDDTVIHLTSAIVSSSVRKSRKPCLVCTSNQVTADSATETKGVRSCCLSCFLAGGVLYRFEYAVSEALFLSRVRGGTCTRATADPDEVVVQRAKDLLLTNGFGSYNLLNNNCENFAKYCKTGSVQTSDQVSRFAATTTATMCVLLT